MPNKLHKMPKRHIIGQEEIEKVLELFKYYESIDDEIGYQGFFEKEYLREFKLALGEEGFADAVCTGTAALYVAVASLQLPKGSQVLISPITDPGTINAVIVNNLVPALVDTELNSYNTSLAEVKKRVTPDTKAIIAVHSAGQAVKISEICDWARSKNIFVIEDCSQAHGAQFAGKKVGTFGDIGVFSTMYRKAHCTGGCGGVLFTKDEKRYNLIRSFSDRGKPFHLSDFDDRNPSEFLFPALNLNIDEISCAIGISSIKKLPGVIKKRLNFLAMLRDMCAMRSKVCRLYDFDDTFSPFFHPVIVDTSQINCTKLEFAIYLKSRGITLNPHYNYVACEWKWLKEYLYDDYQCENALDIVSRSFNLLFNENYGKVEGEYIIDTLVEAEKRFCN